MTLEELTNSIFLELSKIYHVKRIDKNIIGLLTSDSENYDLIIIDRNKPKEKKPYLSDAMLEKIEAENKPSPQTGPKPKKTKEELREIALKAVATRKKNHPEWQSKKKNKSKNLKK